MDIKGRPSALLASWGLELRENVPEKGRGVFADCSFKPGSTLKLQSFNCAFRPAECLRAAGEDILVCRPYVFCVSSNEAEMRCHHCFQPPSANATLLRCSRCKYSLYCSEQCQRKSWSLWHKQECAALITVAPNRPSESMLLLARLCWRRQKEENLKPPKAFTPDTILEPIFSDIDHLLSRMSRSDYLGSESSKSLIVYVPR